VSARGRLLAAAARVTSPVEGLLFGNAGPVRPPVFILGLPRAGTTLVYQVYCHCFAAAFPSKLTDYAPMAPALATWLSRLGRPPYASDFHSRYGQPSRMAAPGEGTMWNLWFGKDEHYATPGDLSPRATREVRRCVGRIERIGGAPFVNKNLRHNHRAGCLAGLFPDALFLVVLREAEAVAASILQARQDLAGGMGRWASLRPSRFPEESDMAPERSAALQVKGILDDLREAVADAGPERFGVLGYAGFCADPNGAMARVHTFLDERGLSLQRRLDPPASFRARPAEDEGLAPNRLESLRAEVRRAFADPAYADWPGVWLTEPDPQRP
jgi:hypothetical protein